MSTARAANRPLDTTDSHTLHGSSVGDMEEQERLLGILF